jgi:hypothetical protein
VPFGDGDDREESMNLVDQIREYAASNYWRWSMDIVATRWTDAEIAVAIAGARTRRGAIAKVWGVLKHIDAARDPFVYGPRPTKPVSLFAYLAAAGGLRTDPELRAVVDGNVFVGGHGWLIRDGGMTLDRARRVAVEGDYLQDTEWSGGVSTSTLDDLLQLIDREARGDRQYPYGQAETDQDFYPEEETDDCPF